MSTDSAFALGTLALTGPRFPDRVRAFLLSVAVVDDLVSLVVIGAAYSNAVVLAPLGVAAGIFAVILLLRRAGIRAGVVYAAAGIAAWVAVLKSGVDPVVVGLVMGLLTFAYPAARADLERASDLFRSFREQPTPELAQSAPRRARHGAVPERAAPAALPSLDQLRHRPAVRARQRRHPAQRRLPRPRLHLPRHPRASSSATSRASRSASPARRGCSPA